MNRLNRALALVLALVLALTCIPALAETQTASAPQPEATSIYFLDSKDVRSVDTVFFTDSHDIPYISVENTAALLRTIADMYGDANYVLESGYVTYAKLVDAGMLSVNDSVDLETKVYVMRRENGSFALVDGVNNMIWLSDRDLFIVDSFAVSGGDMVSTSGIRYLDEEKTETAVNLYKRANAGQFARTGEVTEIDLDNYGISIETLDGSLYVPVATVSDLLMPIVMTYNGQALFLTNGELDNNTVNADGKTQQDLYYAAGTRERSQELATFNYCELCLMLDNSYGLAAEHEIASFDDYFVSIGLADQLCSTDAAVYTDALNQLFRGYFGDLHSGLTTNSAYAGADYKATNVNESISVSEYDERLQRFKAARESAGVTQNGQIVNGYQEVGDTAFITFDSFKGASQNYYDSSLWPNLGDIYMSDTISLVAWAQSRIHRENSPIKKVVIDLSCNGGGSVNACVYVAAWVLGAAELNIESVISGAQYSTNYWVDTNLDGKCLNNDDLGIDSLEVYCLISGNTFSCGNTLAAIFKQDGRVTLLGQTSGGGSCLVRNASSADGTLFAMSDYRRMSIVKNGSFYSIDQGVEPDIALRKLSSYYDRAALAEYLDTLR